MDTVMLNTFVVAASAGSISASAKLLSFSESTVAYHVHEVEKACHGQLFDREVRGLNLTRRGRVVLAVAHELLALVSVLEALPAQPAVDRGSAGSLRTVAPSRAPGRASRTAVSTMSSVAPPTAVGD